MNKKEWLNEAKQFIDSMNTDDFFNFLVSCNPHQVSITKYSISDVKIGKVVLVSGEAANAGNFLGYSGDIAA